MKRLFVKILLIFTALFLITACGEKSEDGKYIYYKAMGEGYVYYEDTKEPAAFAKISVVADFPSFLDISDKKIEDYVADKNGYYKVKFIKRKTEIKFDRVSNGSTINVESQPEIYRVNLIYFDKKYLKNQTKTFKIDTIWLKKFLQ